MKTIFSVRLKKRRKELGMTVKDLAQACGITHGCISQYETGIRDPGYETILILSSVLNLTVDYLIGRSEYSMKDLLADDRMYKVLEGFSDLSDKSQEMLLTVFEVLEGVEQRERREADERHLRTTNRNSRSRT